MARSTKAQVPQAASTVTAPALSIADLRAQQKALREQVKSLKAQTDGSISALAVDGNVVQLDITMGSQPRVTEDGRPYLFNADGIVFAHNGVEYRTSAFYAIATKKPA